MRFLLGFQIALGLIGSSAAWLIVSPMAGWSFGVGAAVTLFNFCVLVFGWPRILARKQFALGVVVIVSKFAILGWILLIVTRSPSISFGWFAAGLATVLPSVVATSVQLAKES